MFDIEYTEIEGQIVPVIVHKQENISVQCIKEQIKEETNIKKNRRKK